MILDLTRFGIFAVLAFLIEPYVFGAMAAYLGIPGGIWALPATIALAAIVLYFARHNIYDGMFAALGIATGVITYDIIGLSVVEFLSQYTSQLYGLLQLAFQFFTFGLAVGFIAGLAFGFGGAFMAGLAAVLGILTVAVIRGGDLVRIAIEGATFGFTKNVPRGYLALTAPFYGLVVVFLPLFFILTILVSIFAMFFGLLIGAAFAGFLLGHGLLVSILAAVVFFGIVTFMRPHGKSIIDTGLDLLALMVWNFTGFTQLLWIAGYAMLLSRFTLREGLYIIGIVTAFLAIK